MCMSDMWILQWILFALFFFLSCSGKGDTVVCILIDLNDFWTYENREYMVTDQSDQDGASAATSW